MDEQYIIDLYNQLGGEGKFGKFEDFKDLIKSDPSYQKDFHNAFGESTLGTFDDFKSLVSAQQPTQQPMAQEQPVKKKEDWESSWWSGDGTSESEPSETDILSRAQKVLGQQPKEEQVEPKKELDLAYVMGTDVAQKQLEKKMGQPIQREEYLTKPMQQIEQKAQFEQKMEKIEEATPEYLRPSIRTIEQSVEKSIINFVGDMNYQFGDAGFEFKDLKNGYFEVKAPDGTVETIRYHTGAEPAKNVVSASVNYFIKTKSAPLKGIDKIERMYKDENKKFATEYQVESEISLLSKEQERTAKEASDFLKRKQNAEAALKAINELPMEKRTLNYRDDKFQAEQNLKRIYEEGADLQKKIDAIPEKQKNLEIALGKYNSKQEKQGTWVGGVYNSMLSFIDGTVAGFTDMAIDYVANFNPLSGYMTAEQKDKIAKDMKYGTEDELTFLEGARKAFKTAFGDKNTTEQWESLTKQSFVGGAVLGAAEFVPSMLIPGAWFRRAAMYASVNNMVDKEFQSNPELQDISENEKLFIKIPIGIVGAVLEEYGVKNIVQNTALVKSITGRAILKATEGMTPAAFKNIVSNEISEMIADGTLRILGGGIMEFETGAAQQGVDIATKSIFNAAKGKKLFDTPDTVIEIGADMALAGAQEMIGSVAVSTPMVVASAYRKKDIAGIPSEYFNIFVESANDKNTEKAFITTLKNNIISGDITNKEAVELLNNYRNSVGLLQSIPSELENADKKKAMVLLNERKELEKKKEGKDPALVKPMQAKIDQINEQLNTLTENAIQKQAAGEVSLQPETGLGKEVVEGESQAGFEAAPKQGVLSPEETQRKEELTTAIQSIEAGATAVTIGEATMDIADAQAELDALLQKEQATPEAQKQTTTDIFTAAPTKTKQAIVFTSPGGIMVSLDGNEQMAAQLYDEAIATPEEQRSQQQNNIVQKMQPLVTAAAPAVEVTLVELDALNQKELSSQQPAVEAAPATEAAKELDADARKKKQLDIINKENPAPNDNNTWVRTVDDILSPEEVFKDNDDFIGTPDFTIENAKDALEKGEIVVYSSFPIRDGVFVTPSKMEATAYAGGKKVYSKKVKINDVAWIDSNEGQYAEIKETEPVTEILTPEQEADKLEQMMLGKMGAPRVEAAPVTETPMAEEKVEEEAKLEIPKAEEVADIELEIKDVEVTPDETQKQVDDFNEESLLEQEKPKAGQVAELSIDEINADPERFQYKEVTDKEAGVTEKFKEEKAPFKKELAGVISVWVDPADGKTYVINGHHRLDFAKRSGEKTMNVIYIDAKDASEARLKGAMQNIAEGMGTDMDAAKVFRETGMTVEQVQASGISVKGAKAINGLALASLSDSLFNLVAQGKLSQTIGIIIGSTIKSKEVQEQFYKVIKGKNINNATIKVMAEDIQAAPTETVEQMDIFGVSATEQAAYQQRASFIAGIRAIVSKAKNILGKTAKSARFLEEYGNEINEIANETGSKESAMALAVFDRLRNTSPEIRALIDKGVERIKNGENKNKVLNETAKQIIEATPRILEGVTGQPVAGRGEVKEPSTKGKQGATGKEEGVVSEKPKTKKSNKTNTAETKKADDKKPAIGKVIPTSEKTLSTAASLGGVAYELPGGVAIIQVFNLFGKPIYIGYKNGTYTKIDIDSFDNKNNVFTEQELNDLKNLKKEIENQENKNQSDSKNPFTEQGRVAATDSVPNNIKQFVENLTKALGINKKIFIITDNDFNEGQYKKHGLFGTLAAIRSAILGAKNPFEFGAKRYMSDADAYYIYYDGNLKGSELFSVISHEIGHIVEQELFKNASKETVEAIKNDYNNWVAKLTGKTLTEVQNETRDITIQHLLQGNVSMFDPSVHKYISSFSEYLADNVAKWARTSQKPKTLVDKFFSNLVNEFKKIRDYVFKTGNYSESVFKWLDELYDVKAEKEITTGKKLSDAVRSLKIKGPGGLQSNILGVPIAIWNAAMDTVAKAIDAGVALSSAVQKGYDYIKDKHKAINKERFDKKVLIGMYSGAIEMAREGNISDAGIKTYLTRQGLTESQADALLKIKPKAEKKPISKEKIIGKPKPKKVTVNEMTALKDQIRLEARAAREAKGDLNKKRKMLIAAINEMKKKGSISVRQAKALINRVNSVNLDNPVMVERLLTYAENVFNDADYDTRVQEVRKLQEQVKKVNHVSMKDTVREFASINPERIPADKLLDYIQALDDMNTRTPSYEKMNNMFDEVMSYKAESKEFDAIKTFQALIDKLESIAINQVKSVEDYVALIRDINAFKRKAYQLLQNGAITQEQYDEAIENVGKDQAAVEKKYEKELTALKKGLVQEIIGLKPEVHPDFTPEEAALINKYLELSEADLESLSPEDLYILNDLLNNIKEDVQLDYYRLSEIVSKAYTNEMGQKLAEQLNESKFDKSSDEGKKLLLEQESAFWEGLLGLGRATSGALQKFIVSPFNRAISSFENFMKDGYSDFLKLKKKYNMKDYNMHRLGIFTTYLQEYMAQFDPANKNVKDIGKRDWFGEIISDEDMRDGYRSAKPSAKRLIGMGDTDLKTIEKIYNSLPKDANGKVDPKAVYDSYMANDGKYFTKEEKAFFDKVMQWKQKNLTTKQKAANEMNGMPFKEIPFHMTRVRLNRGAKQISPKAEGGSGVVRIDAGTGKERSSQKVGPIMTNFEQLFTENLEQTARNYYLQEAINDINNTLSVARKGMNEKKTGLFNTIPGAISEALNFEFDKTDSQVVFKSLLAARAAETLFSPIRTAVELTSAFISYPFRAKTPQGYRALFGKQGQMKKLLDFTNSPIRLRDNINKAIDISDGRIKPMGRFEKAVNYLSGLPERTMLITSWMPTFENEFKDITGNKFDMDEFNSSAAYRQEYGKAIKEAAAAADAQTEKIIGSTTKAGGRREIRIAPKILANVFGLEGTVKKNTSAGQILGFFSNYPYREVTEFLNGFREAAEVYRQGGKIKSISQLQKPLGVIINLAAYGFLSSVVYAMKLMLLGDDEDEEKGEGMLKELMTPRGFMEELQGNAISLAASKYAAGGKAMLQMFATIAYNSTSDKEQKAKIKKILKNSVFVEPIDAEKVQGYGGKNELLGAISSYVPQLVLLAKRIDETIQTAGELNYIYKKFQDGGLNALSEDEGLAILAIDGLLKSTQTIFNFTGTSLPMYNDIKMYMKGAKKDAGVGDIKLTATENKHKKALQGHKNETEFKENDPDGYLKAIDEGGSLYEYKLEQSRKEAEKGKPLTDSQIERLKKENPREYKDKYGPGTDYFKEQRTPEAIKKRAEMRRIEAEAKRIKKKNERNKEK